MIMIINLKFGQEMVPLGSDVVCVEQLLDSRRLKKLQLLLVILATSKSILTKEVEVTGEVIEKKIEDIDDEIELTEISVKAEETAEEECVVDQMIKIEGEFKNPNLKPWTKFDPEEEVKLMWDIIKKESKNKGIEEMGDASATFEHCFEFWGTWKIRKPGMKLKYLQNSENWTKGFKITEVRPP